MKNLKCLVVVLFCHVMLASGIVFAGNMGEEGAKSNSERVISKKEVKCFREYWELLGRCDDSLIAAYSSLLASGRYTICEVEDIIKAASNVPPKWGTKFK